MKKEEFYKRRNRRSSGVRNKRRRDRPMGKSQERPTKSKRTVTSWGFQTGIWRKDVTDWVRKPLEYVRTSKFIVGTWLLRGQYRGWIRRNDWRYDTSNDQWYTSFTVYQYTILGWRIHCSDVLYTFWRVRKEDRFYLEGDHEGNFVYDVLKNNYCCGRKINESGFWNPQKEVRVEKGCVIRVG